MNPFGMQLFEAPRIPVIVPIRLHKKRRNQTEAYHLRIEKKWRKRFGMCEEVRIIQMGDAIFAPPEVIAEMRRMLG